uniref:C2 domain-containing protein n=1 Tax=Davidia involucrata TaxID=16924 RepID=A0A5B7B843_DAVIN
MSPAPFHLLELSVISAQDLAPVSKTLRTYAVAWVNPERKLRTRIDHQGLTNPTWNDKFVFRVGEKFLNSESSEVMIEIYALGWLRDIPVGSVRVLIGNLIPPSIRKQSNSSRRFVALQIRRPSGRPQGILNMGVSLIDSTMRSMPMYRELSAASAAGYRDLMDAKGQQPNQKYQEDQKEITTGAAAAGNSKILLWRSQSDRTCSLNNAGGFTQRARKGASSACNASMVNGGSSSMCNGGSSSIVYGGSEVGLFPVPKPMVGGGNGNNNGSFCSDVGPSPSVVAAAMAKGLYPTPMAAVEKPGSSILEDWTVEESSVEGLKSKIERWRMELPALYDRDRDNYQKLAKSTPRRSTPRRTTPRRSTPHGHSRRHTEGDRGGGLFSCFGNAYGCEFTIVCGANNDRKGSRRRSDNSSELDSLAS